jgi:hypothetical protein
VVLIGHRLLLCEYSRIPPPAANVPCARPDAGSHSRCSVWNLFVDLGRLKYAQDVTALAPARNRLKARNAGRHSRYRELTQR